MTPLLPAPPPRPLLPPPLFQRAAPHFVGQGVYVTTRAGTFVCDPRRLGEAFAAVMALEPHQLALPWAA